AYADGGDEPLELVLDHDKFLHNSAGAAGAEGFGGAIFIYYYSTVDVRNTTISGNTAIGSSTGAAGGGVYNEGDQSSSWAHVTTTNTRATGTGSYGGGVYTYGYSDSFTDSTIDGNKAEQGGGIYAEYYSLRLNRSTISHNVAGSAGHPGQGGGIYD